MKRNPLVAVIIVIVVVLLVIAGVVALSGNNNKPKATDTMNMNNQTSTEKKTTTSEATNAVAIQNFAFSPANITVKVGDTVTWTNQDTVAHTVVADDGVTGGPNSELLDKGKTYSFTFTKAGTYAYHCGVHPNMKGTVTVTE